jgi:hypothetical protein
MGKEENNREKSEKKEKKKKKDSGNDLEYCTTAPSAEHARAHDEDEPCDDSRAGNVE